MKALFALSLSAVLLFGCAKQQQADNQPGAAQSAYTDVIDSKRGYIVENAKFAMQGDQALFTIGEKFRLASGTSSVLIIRDEEMEGRPGYILALQFPAFAAGTTMDFSGDAQLGQFCVVGKTEGKSLVVPSGLISGSLRFVKKEASSIDLGLNRDISDGIGDIDIVVSNISAEGLKFEASKTFNARYQLPVISLEELAKINTPT